VQATSHLCGVVRTWGWGVGNVRGRRGWGIVGFVVVIAVIVVMTGDLLPSPEFKKGHPRRKSFQVVHPLYNCPVVPRAVQ
jgi:hypothetical protein